MEWQTVILSPADILMGNHIRLLQEFAAIFALSGAPPSAKLLGNNIGDNCLAFYFSPRAASLFEVGIFRWGAMTSEPPHQDECELLIGHPDDAIPQ